jgi:hypothetical protein
LPRACALTTGKADPLASVARASTIVIKILFLIFIKPFYQENVRESNSHLL